MAEVKVTTEQFPGYRIAVDNKPISPDQLFDIYRKYIIHQYDLFNHRTNWYVALNAFLFGTYGFTIQKRLDVLVRPDSAAERFANELWSINVFLFAMSALGVALSVLVFKLLRAASAPIKQLQTEFDIMMTALAVEREQSSADQGRLPYVVGAFDARFMERGRTLTTLIPCIVGPAWVGIMLFTIDYPFVKAFLGGGLSIVRGLRGP